jgi:two-component system LytT family response regulator
MNLRAVIVDDEPIAQTRLRWLLENHPDIVVVGAAANAREAAFVTAARSPDVLFVDIEMPGATGMDFVRQLEPRPAIVFTTAHPQYAVEAFDENAVDYLLKPVSAFRLAETLDRVRRSVGSRGMAPPPEAPFKTERIAVRKRSEIIFVAPSDITWVAAEGNYCRLYATGTSYLVRQLIGDFAERVGSSFIRVHRSAVVNIDHVCRITGNRAIGYSIQMLDGTKISVGDSYAGVVHNLLRRAL